MPAPAPAATRQRLAGPFQLQVLAALVRLGANRFGLEVQRHVSAHTRRPVSPQQVYEALERLEARGFVRSWRRPPLLELARGEVRMGPRRPARPRRFFRLTVAGRRALRLTGLAIDQLRHGLPGLGHEDRLYRAAVVPPPPPLAARRPPDAAARARHARSRWNREMEIMARRLAKQRLLRLPRGIAGARGCWPPRPSRGTPPAV
jgi:DNA-binding PadR family transcriptional regulator